MANPSLMVLICSTRPGRICPAIANWFFGVAQKHAKFDSELVDLAGFNLPLYNEPNHPVMQKYEHEETRKWAAAVARFDAYVFVMPEYNYNPSPAFTNALNYLYKEWCYKPCAFVGYGGISGGLRAIQTAKLLATTLKMMPMYESVPIPNVFGLLADEGGQKVFKANEHHEKGANAMLDETLKWANALKTMRG
jgi:NAD(P)H-dependent FMN reductase